MVDYVETPWDPLVAVHWASPPKPCAGSEKCFSSGYGWGARLESGILVPYGPDIVAPFSGADFDTVGDNGPEGAWGGLLHPYLDADGHLIAATLPCHMDIAKVLTLTSGDLRFENEYLLTLDDGAGGDANEVWAAPMSSGAKCVARKLGDDSNPPFFPDPYVTLSYKIDLAWSCPADGINCNDGDLFAWTITHPGHETQDPDSGVWTDVFEPLWPPTPGPQSEPLFGPYERTGGTSSFTYEYKYQTNLKRQLAFNFSGATHGFINDDNFNDLTIGGDVLLWSMFKRFDSLTGLYSAWEPFISPDHLFFATDFMIDVLVVEGAWATWHVTPTCIVERDAP